MTDAEGTIRALVASFSAHDEPGMRSVLAADLVAYITNAEGGVDRVTGSEEYLQRLLALQAPKLEVNVTQSVTVAPGQAMAMVEIRAERKGRTLHNFAAFLSRTEHERITELWMVDALPAYSDEFWR
jgi:hypothetical protein